MKKIPYTALWVAWTAVTLLSFAVLETFALITGDMSHTLSDHLRIWLGLTPGAWWGVPAGAALLSFLTWFGWHIVFQRDK